MKNLENKRVFVTGATGLVGGFVVEKLLKCKAQVITLIRDEVCNSYLETSGNLGKCTVVRGELENAALISRIVNEYQIEGIVHLAAQTQVRVANENPIPTFRANIEGTWNLLEAARQNRKFLKAVIIASSDKAYGEAVSPQYDEQHPLNAKFPYDVSKACADLIAKSYFSTFALPVCVTRCGNFFGPGDLNWDRVIPHVIQSFLNKKSPQIRSNGKLVRDYFYVKDGAEAYLFLLNKMFQDGFSHFGEAFNFSYGTHLSVLELTSLIAKLMKCENIPPTVLNQSTHEIEFQSLSSQKVRTYLGWEPSFTLDLGLKETIEWYKGVVAG